MKEFYMVGVGEKLMEYDGIGVNRIVMKKENEVS